MCSHLEAQEILITFKKYLWVFSAALAPTVQTRVGGAVITWYCRHLSSLLVEGQALWCSLASAPVSADYRRVIERSCSYERLWCQPTYVYRDSGDTPTPPPSTLSVAPNEVITVLQTRVTLTFAPCSSLCCNVNNFSRHLCCGGSPPPHTPFPVTLDPHWWLVCRAVTQVASVYGNQGGLMSFNETDVERR